MRLTYNMLLKRDTWTKSLKLAFMNLYLCDVLHWIKTQEVKQQRRPCTGGSSRLLVTGWASALQTNSQQREDLTKPPSTATWKGQPSNHQGSLLTDLGCWLLWTHVWQNNGEGGYSSCHSPLTRFQRWLAGKQKVRPIFLPWVRDRVLSAVLESLIVSTLCLVSAAEQGKHFHARYCLELF